MSRAANFCRAASLRRIQPSSDHPKYMAGSQFAKARGYCIVTAMEMTNYAGRPTEPHVMNRRAFPRWPVPYDLLYGKARERRSAEPLEIGEGGLSFRTSSEIAVGSEIAVEFRFGPENEWMHVKCIVRHVDKNSVGVEFLNLRMADRLRIVDFVSAK